MPLLHFIAVDRLLKKASRLGLIARGIAMVGVFWLAPFAGSTQAETAGYTLGPGDRLQVRVLERPDVTGEYRVGPEGNISLPLAGTVAALGRTRAEMVDAIGAALGIVKLERARHVAVEVAEFRPIFVLGDVEAPGAYPPRNKMTVLHAIALAKGFRVLDSREFSVRLAKIQNRERARRVGEGLGLALVRRARLQAEQNGQLDFDLPAATGGYLTPGKQAEAFAGETAILRDRTSAFDTHITALEKSKSIYDEEINALQGQYDAEVLRAKLAAEEIAELDQPKDRRVVPRTLLLELRRQAAKIEGDKRALIALIARARVQRDSVDRRILQLRGDREIELTSALKTVGDNISRLAIELKGSREVLTHAADFGFEASRGERGKFSILRPGPEGFESLHATELTALKPGDVVRIPSRELLAPSPAPLAPD